MKKTILIALCAFALLAAGCSKDNGGKKDKNPKVAKLEAVFNLTAVSQDILEYYTATFKITDFKGETNSYAITSPKKITVSIDNPELGEVESCPFTVELTFQDKGTAAKAEGSQYNKTLSYALSVNAYYSDGSLVTDSGDIIYVNETTSSTALDLFKRAISRYSIEESTYRTFFCKTITGEWHIGTVKGRDE